MEEKPKILLIEDDRDLVAALQTILMSRGYEVVAVYDPLEADEELQKSSPDMIILDVMFGSSGESKGFDFATQIRTNSNFSHIPILMMTAINSLKPQFNFSPATDGEFLPVDSFIDKPVRSEDLVRKVEELLSLKTSKWRNWPDKEE